MSLSACRYVGKSSIVRDVADTLIQRRRFQHVVYADLRGACQGQASSLRRLLHAALQTARVPGVSGERQTDADLVRALTATPTLLVLDNIDSLLSPHGGGPGEDKDKDKDKDKDTGGGGGGGESAGCVHCRDLPLCKFLRDAVSAVSSSGALEPLKVCYTASARAVSSNHPAAVELRTLVSASVAVHPLTPENLKQVADVRTVRYAKGHLGYDLRVAVEKAYSGRQYLKADRKTPEEDLNKQRAARAKEVFSPEEHKKKVKRIFVSTGSLLSN